MCITVKNQADTATLNTQSSALHGNIQKILILQYPLYLSGYSKSPVLRWEKLSPTFLHKLSSLALTAAHNQEGCSCCHASRWSQLIPELEHSTQSGAHPRSRQLGTPDTLYLSVNQSEAKQLLGSDSIGVSPRTYHKLFL